MITKNHILDEIRRTAKENRDIPLGTQRFCRETGIRETDWERYWARWGDALIAAGFSPNRLQGAYDLHFLLEKLAGLARELGHFPTEREIKLKHRNDDSFPSAEVFQRRGSKNKLATKLLEYCQARPEYEDVAAFCAPLLEKKEKDADAPSTKETFGYIYLLKSGKYCKIGRTNSVGRREYELVIQLPEKGMLVHKIKTDDPSGIEQYWHKRFEGRHKNGEWFELSAQDISAFKRRKFM